MRPVKRVHDAFLVLRPSAPLMNLSDAVYRSHCRELLDRVRRGEDTRQPTEAELAAALYGASLRAPLDGTHALLYARLLARVIPGGPDHTEGLREAYEGAADEARRALARAMVVPTRVGPAPEKKKTR